MVSQSDPILHHKLVNGRFGLLSIVPIIFQDLSKSSFYFINLINCHIKTREFQNHIYFNFKGVRDPERVAGHMFRMAVLALILEDDCYDKRILNGSAVIISLVHDIAG